MRKIPIAAVAILLLIAAVPLWATEFHFGPTVNTTWNSGYKSGPGFMAGFRARGRTFGFETEGLISREMKVGAKDGHTYGAYTSVTISSADWVFGAGVARYGYWSLFKNGVVWAKSTTTPFASVGYESQDNGFEADLKYLFPENQTQNKLESAILSVAAQIKKYSKLGLWTEWRAGFSRATQSGKRVSSGSLDFRFIFRWKS